MNTFAKYSLLLATALTLGLGLASSAEALPGAKPKAATLQDITAPSVSSPEIASAEQRVEQAKAQVDLANKQVGAAKALLKAAQADLKAAQAQVDALKAAATAQGLVEQTGMTPAKAAPVPIAAKTSETKTTDAATTPATAPKPTPAPTGEDGRIKSDFNAEQNSEPIQLR